MMATEGRARLVVDERPLALGTRLDMAAVAAEDDGRGPAPVDREDRLLATVPVKSLQRLDEGSGQEPTIAAPELLPQVHHVDPGPLAGRPRRQHDPAIGPLAGSAHRI